MSLNIIRPGLLTTIQDTGRYGYQKIGVIPSGAMDVYSLRLANILVGNDENEGALEITLMGPTIEFTSDTLIAITGGDFGPVIDGQKVPMHRPVAVKAGAILRFGPVSSAAGLSGCCRRVRRARRHGQQEHLSAGSVRRVGRAGPAPRRFAEYEGAQRVRPADDVQPADPRRSFLYARPLEHQQGSYDAGALRKPIKVMAGLQYDEFTEKAKYDFFGTDFLITTQSDRMGYRLNGPKLEMKRPLEMISEVAGLGTVQVPPNGMPIILMADHQTTAGYPVIGQVALVDVARVAQLKPGDRMYFRLISNEEGERLFIDMERCMENIKIAVAGML